MEQEPRDRADSNHALPWDSQRGLECLQWCLSSSEDRSGFGRHRAMGCAGTQLLEVMGLLGKGLNLLCRFPSTAGLWAPGWCWISWTWAVLFYTLAHPKSHFQISSTHVTLYNLMYNRMGKQLLGIFKTCFACRSGDHGKLQIALKKS